MNKIIIVALSVIGLLAAAAIAGNVYDHVEKQQKLEGESRVLEGLAKFEQTLEGCFASYASVSAKKELATYLHKPYKIIPVSECTTRARDPTCGVGENAQVAYSNWFIDSQGHTESNVAQALATVTKACTERRGLTLSPRDQCDYLLVMYPMANCGYAGYETPEIPIALGLLWKGRIHEKVLETDQEYATITAEMAKNDATATRSMRIYAEMRGAEAQAAKTAESAWALKK